MIKIVVVEDEPLMNKFIADSLDWSKLGLELCGVFYNGKSALEFLKNNPADIVVTDIQMPIMNGLALISHVLEFRPETKFIVLSNFDDFDMVKNAFKLGVSDYILKTDFEASSFQKLLLDISNKILNSDKPDILSMNIKEYSLKQFFWNNASGTDMPQNLRIDISHPLRVAMLKLLNYDDILKNVWNMEKELMKFGLSNCIEEVLENHGLGEFFFNGYDEILFLFPADGENIRCDKASEVFTEIFGFLASIFDMTSAAAIYDFTQILDIKEQYQMVNQCISYSFLLGINRLILCTDTLNFTDMPDVGAILVRLDSLLSNMEFNSVPKLLGEIKNPAYICIPAIRDMYQKLVSKLLDIHAEYSLPVTGSCLADVSISCSCVSELNRIISEACAYLSENLEYSDVVITQIQNYIRQNYSADLSLQLLAKQFVFSYTDLSRRFQKATGMSFSKFLKEVRLTEAMKLIKTTDFKCSQISSMVGYNNYENFHRAFKEKYQKTPNEARKAGRQ